jgi:AmiR/NasT family two-component response regulator
VAELTQQSPLSVRGRTALTMVRDEREFSIIRRQLNRLGVQIVPWETGSPDMNADVVLLDADLFLIEPAPVLPIDPATPIVALIGIETPSRLKWLLDLKPASFLIKPIRSAGLYSALVMAFGIAEQRTEAAERIKHLETRVRSRRLVIAAILYLMENRKLTESAAFALIRRTAMQRRTTIEELSAEIVASGGQAPLAVHTS